MAFHTIFERGVTILESLGISDVLLPFLLIFTIVFAILQKIEILGERKKNLNVVVALVMALAVVIPHVTESYPPGADVVEIINRALPNVGVVAVVIIMLLLLVGLLSGKDQWGGGSSFAGLLAAVAFIAVIWIFYRAARPYGTYSEGAFGGVLANPDVQALLIIIIIFGLVIWFITKEPGETSGQNFLKTIRDWFKSGGH
ncbi:hypothetical protein HYS48_04860 [Candidatus Woesearchaeota archaeon]|nr:hypothetical protein [Candidatus Woesearchaeota archaeon]